MQTLSISAHCKFRASPNSSVELGHGSVSYKLNKKKDMKGRVDRTRLIGTELGNKRGYEKKIP
jgi:hypothetical protein